MDPQLRRSRTFEAVVRLLLAEASPHPLILIFEDLHWLDDESQALLDLLVESMANSRILLLVNYRPEYALHWGDKIYCHLLRLESLERDSADEMLSAILGKSIELLPLKQLIIETTGGTPFFMEETVQALFDEGALNRSDGMVKLVKPLAALRIPPTVQTILAARIDRLRNDEKNLLQTLAVLGREFVLNLARSVAGRSEDEFERLIANLQLGEFVYEQPSITDVEYIFKHALTQEVAYNSILLERRKQLHEDAGRDRVALSIVIGRPCRRSGASFLAQRQSGEGGRISKACRHAGDSARGIAASRAESRRCLGAAENLP
jgi:predicted ATPase